MAVSWQSRIASINEETRMSAESHLAELQRRHEALDNRIREAETHPSIDDLEIRELKRRKLVLKDQIEMVKQGRRESLH